MIRSPGVVESLDLASLSAAYRDGGMNPSTVVEAVIARLHAAGDDKVWITRLPPADLRARAAELEGLTASERACRPLFGIPFAVKDNIDVEGLTTTAACPEFSYIAENTATAVCLLLQAGAILVGKTNMDQFATGLVGVRSPYGTPRNPFDPDFIPGGSSSGSAVAVAKNSVSFTLGTDTAGSGRVPAGFTNIVGLKPSKGLVSTRGVVPACRSLDCVSVFALTVVDAMKVLAVIAEPDSLDPFSRIAPAMPAAFRAPLRFGVPFARQLRFFGDVEAERLFGDAVMRLRALGAQHVEIDFSPFDAVTDLLYGPWVAERMAAVGDFLAANPNAGLDVTRKIIMGGAERTAVEAFKASYVLEALRRKADQVWDQIDVMLLPTAGTIYRVAEVEADPDGTNNNLGIYTNFVNLLDLCGIAVPSAIRADHLPFGITLLAPAFREAALAGVAAQYHRAVGLPMGATNFQMPAACRISYSSAGLIHLFVVGGHLAGQALNAQLTDRGAQLIGTSRTAPRYRLYALPGTPARPGMIQVNEGGAAIEGEVWSLTPADFGQFVSAIPAPLGIGKIELMDGRSVCGFLCEASAIAGTTDISGFGGWRAWLASQ